jgi:hypothetical protein
MRNLKETNILLTKWKVLSREKPLRGSQTQDIHNSKNKASYKAIALTYLDAVVVPWTLTRTYTWTLLNQVSYLKGLSMESFSLGLLPKLDFTGWLNHTINTLRELAHITIFA